MSYWEKFLPNFLKIDNTSKQTVGMYDPMPVTGRTILWNEIDYDNCDFTGWSGTEEDHRKLFQSPFSTPSMEYTGGDNPKKLTLAFYDSVNLQRIGFGENNGGDFSNLKISILGSGGATRAIFDESTNNTKRTSRNAKIENEVANSLLIEFYTTDTVSLSNITLPYATYGMVQNEAQQPDGDYVGLKTDGNAFSTDSLLAASGIYLSNWIDSDGWATIQLFLNSDVASATQGLEVEFTDDTSAVTPLVQATKRFTFSATDVRRGFKEIPIQTLSDGFRVRYINGDEDQSSFYLEAALRVATNPQSFNEDGAQVTTDFNTEIAFGNASNYGKNVKYGRNDDVDSAAEDIVEGGGTYTGFNATANENLAILSSSGADTGTLVSSGTITTTSVNQVIDTGATFITDGVAVGDMVLNDTQSLHGVIISVDSETTFTVDEMCDGDIGRYYNILGDTYRIASAASTGAAVMRVSRILDEDYALQIDELVILNGVTTVTVTTNAMRCSRAEVLLAGSTGSNEGVLACVQAVTTANQFWEIAVGINKTLNAADTVPANISYLIKRMRVSMVRANGAAGSAVFSLRVRRFGEVFQAERYEAFSTGYPYDEELLTGISLKPKSDYKFRIENTSDQNNEVSARVEHLIKRV